MHKTISHDFDTPFKVGTVQGTQVEVDQIEMRGPALKDGWSAQAITGEVMGALKKNSSQTMTSGSESDKDDKDDKELSGSQLMVAIIADVEIEKLMGRFMKFLKQVAVLKGNGEIINANGSMENILCEVPQSEILSLMGDYIVNFLLDSVFQTKT